MFKEALKTKDLNPILNCGLEAYNKMRLFALSYVLLWHPKSWGFTQSQTISMNRDEPVEEMLILLDFP